MLRFLALLLTQLILWNLGIGLNNAVSGWNLSLFTQGLFVLVPAFFLSPKEGLLACLLAGCLVDASLPVHFGREAILFAILFTFMLRQRPRLPLHEPLVQSAVAVILNLILYGCQLALEARRITFLSEMVWRIVWELLLSSLLVALLAPWFCSLQRLALDWASRPWFARDTRNPHLRDLS